jgi:TatD DNase family protein
VDAHCHVQFEQYQHDEADVIARMQEAGVVGIVVGVDLASSKRAIALAQMHPHLFAAVGLHPNREREERFEPAVYRELAAHPKVVAIGECGLDYYRPQVLDEETKRRQKNILADQIALAAELDKPLIIHARPSKGTQDAYQELIGILARAKEAHPKLAGDIHFFVGGKEEMRSLTSMGFCVSYTAVITFAADYDDVVRAAPLSSLLSETDAPYVAPASRRRERNDPLAVQEVVERIAMLRGEPVEAVRTALADNAIRLFKLPLKAA